MEIVLILAAGALGALVGIVLRLPAGALLGAMSGAALLQLLADVPISIDPGWSLAGQILVGAAIGSSLDRRVFTAFRAVLVPGVIAVGATLAGGLAVGVFLIATTDLGPATALFGIAPGGVSEMTAAAVALGANGPLVAAMHTIRVVIVLSLLPLLLRRIAARSTREPGPTPEEATR